MKRRGPMAVGAMGAAVSLLAIGLILTGVRAAAAANVVPAQVSSAPPPALRIDGWAGESEVDGRTKRPGRDVVVAGAEGRLYHLQVKPAKERRRASNSDVDRQWKTIRQDVWTKGDGAATVRLPRGWARKAKAQWRLAFPETDEQPRYVTEPWVVTRTPFYGPVNCKKVTCVALTFDDGPGPETSHLLDRLNKRKAPATFFVLGSQATKRRAIVERAVRQGHQVESHTYTHRDLKKLTARQIARELKSTSSIISRSSGTRPHLVRPPYGNTDARVLGVLKRLGWPIITWNVDTQDWLHRSGAAVLQHVRRDTRPGSIILMHDIHHASISVIDSIITDLRKRGYTLVTVDDLLGTKLTAGRVYRDGEGRR